ncbi:hypothetical protein D3C71_1183290 [compost metagenome]
MPVQIAVRIRPRAGSHHNHAGHQPAVQFHTGQAGAPPVEHADPVAVPDLSRGGVSRVHGDGFASPDLARTRQGRGIQLAVQAVARLIRQQVQRPLVRHVGAQPFRRRQPRGVSRAIGVAKASHHLRMEFDLARGRTQGMRRRIPPEGFEQHILRIGWRQLGMAALPEFVERRQRHAPLGAAAAHAFVYVAAPAHLVAPGGERLMKARAPRQLGKDIEVVAGLALRGHRPMHGEYIGIARRTAHVAAFERRRGRQHDVRAARQRRPPGFMHDHGFGLAPCVPEPVLVLMVMEGISSRPIDQPDVRVGVPRAVEFVFGAG